MTAFPSRPSVDTFVNRTVWSAAIYVPVLAVAFSGTATAQGARTGAVTSSYRPDAVGVLTLDEAIRLALAVNPDLIAIRREVEAAAALRVQAGLLPNPTISYSLEDVRRGIWTSSVTVTQPFELGGKRAARVRAAEGAATVAQADVSVRRVEVRAAVVQFYYDVLAAQQRERLALASVDLARRAVDVTARRVEAGRVSPVEETRARTAEAAARVEVSQARTELDNARQRLASLFGERAPRFETVAGGLDDLKLPDEPAAVAARLARAPELVRARAEIERRAAAEALARTQRIPDVAVNAGNVSIPEAQVRANVVGVSVNVPLFNRNQGNIAEAVVRTEQAREQLAAAEVRIHAEVLQAQRRLSAARRETALVRDEILPGARGALDAATRGYELGRFGFLDVLDAQRTLFAAQGQFVRAVADAYQSAAELERLLGPEISEDDVSGSRRP